MIEINNKVYRNIQEQVAKNQEDIEDLQKNTYNKDEINDALDLKANASDVYDKDTADATFQTIAGMSNYALKKYRHRLLLNHVISTYNEFVVFDIVNDKPEAYTTLDDILEAIGNNNIIAIQGILSIGASIFQVSKNGSNLRVYFIETSSYTLSYTDFSVDSIDDEVLEL